MRSTKWQIWIAAVVVSVAAARSAAQQCDDYDPCTTNDMCTPEGCGGAPTTGGSCDDFNECTINDVCTAEGCMGEAAPVGTSCQGGCGTCQPPGGVPFPGIPLLCTPKAGVQGQSCTPPFVDGPALCLEGTCQVQFGITVVCFPRQKVCPDTDGNPCNDACNPATGQCEVGASTCFPGCETCNPQTGACEATNIGAACDDFDPCTPLGHCAINPVVAGRGVCLPGTPGATATPTQAVPTPTRTATQRSSNTPVAATTTPSVAPPTATSGAATPTPSSPAATNTPGGGSTPTEVEATRTPGGGCQGDCNSDGIVKVNELILQVNIALGNAELSRCPAGDGNKDGRIAINELIRATGNALNGCAAAAGL